ncbi:MAG: outer membrane lipoprotein carrier protein LolA [Deltaproteobacteria bacterium]|nr:outer membrane lipoprotein carrier protein LolA [Deltaproteobacteria bacterium]MCB9786249.1 outer membrane lipoprotein carrier protein LolA [Deltaproteobacteria bacterium]
MRSSNACRSRSLALASGLLLLALVGARAQAAEPTPTRTPAPDATPVTLDSLLGAFQKMPGLEARFVEAKHLALLAAPLESSGHLYFVPPGLLARHTEAPSPSRVVIAPDAVRYSDAEGSGRIDLSARPDVRTFVESFVRVLAGDREGLARIYELKFQPPGADDPRWTLELVPRGPPLRELVTRLRIRGQGLAVEEIRVDEASGDYSVTRILEADPQRRFTPEERARLFDVSPR